MSDRLADADARYSLGGPPRIKIPTRHCRNPGNGSTLEHQVKGGISGFGSCRLASTLQSLHLSYIKTQCSVSSYSKGSQDAFRTCRGYTASSTASSISLSLRVETAYAIRAGRNLPDKEFATLGPLRCGLRGTGRSRQELNADQLTFRHRAGVTP